jgi:hypothetical protein
MKIGIVGISGFVGSAFARAAREAGHVVVGFSRTSDKTADKEMEMRRFDMSQPLVLEGLDAVVNFGGRSIFTRWTKRHREEILHSRIDSTRHVVNSMKGHRGIRSLINISAIGYYGNRGEEELTEDASPGAGFLSEVTQAWEAQALRAEKQGVRVVLPRLGMVMGRHGGAMKLMKPVFRCGLGGRLGSGRQWMSCIHVEDVAQVLLFALREENLRGPVNTVMPEPFRNADFTRAAAHAAHRPAIFHVPAFAMKLAMGSMSHLMLDSQKVVPKLLCESGYAFRFPAMDSALKEIFE